MDPSQKKKRKAARNSTDTHFNFDLFGAFIRFTSPLPEIVSCQRPVAMFTQKRNKYRPTVVELRTGYTSVCISLVPLWLCFSIICLLSFGNVKPELEDFTLLMTEHFIKGFFV
ncbi:hypothetical protein JTE90_026763 [Oedothorax gibbosus]|uniref:Uncharacterized protein n=1 Tax=Oedothorax gibbosus TaxID=931172 RepID=A0AAV6UX08_9ARAC|nr:hypothetical protein JTE90_026763 [Oedothorax gibbosus]